MQNRLREFTSHLALATSCVFVLASCSSSEPQSSAPSTPAETSVSSTSASATCADISGLSLDYTEISMAETVAPGAFSPPPNPMARPADYSGMPEFCRVAGSIKPTESSDIRFEAWLPTESNWNGKFMQVGNGGAAGSLMYGSMAEPLSRGYAVVHTDTGHKGTAGDFSWAFDAPEKLIDYQYRAVHELTVKGKAITEARYGEAPEKAYWFGCSTGGRQGLKEAQRFPEDYDAIIAGAPANNWGPLQLYSILALNSLGENGLPISKLPMLKAASVGQCDANDGLEDGIISAPQTCNFRPEALTCQPDDDVSSCLTEQEVSAAERLYAGIVLNDGTTVFPGSGFGSETDWGVYATPFFRIGTSYMQNVVLKDKDWDPSTLDMDADLKRAWAVDQGEMTAMEPDLTDFIGNGGKLLMYHGTTDGIIAYGNTRNYYESIIETMGQDAIEDSVQFITVPGMGHCGGGDGASQIDWISALESWDETGAKPVKLTGTKPGSDPVMSRPVCAYPQSVIYDGEGDPSSADSFACKDPS